MQSERPPGVILVVEDEWLIREEIVSQLRDAGWEVLEASTAEGAIGLFNDASQRIDVLITDIQLSGYLSGWDVAEAFRSAQPDAAVVYASGNTVDRSRAVADSIFFSKPYRVAEVLNACRKLLEP